MGKNNCVVTILARSSTGIGRPKARKDRYEKTPRLALSNFLNRTLVEMGHCAACHAIYSYARA